jgi:hypothetical protein
MAVCPGYQQRKRSLAEQMHHRVYSPERARSIGVHVLQAHKLLPEPQTIRPELQCRSVQRAAQDGGPAQQRCKLQATGCQRWSTYIPMRAHREFSLQW